MIHIPFLPAYIGPGAGFAFLGSFLTLLTGLFLGLVSVLSWPFRVVWRSVRHRSSYKRARVRKVIVLGLDGLDPVLAERLMDEGKLPHLAELRKSGSYQRLRTTFPALSPVAWSTFATGVSPAKHNIFDFLDRDLRTYLPRLSSARVGKPARVLQARPIPHPAQPDAPRTAPQEPHILEHSRRARRRLHHSPRPHHVPAGAV